MANKKQKCAFITGVTGMDGSYLSDFLIEKGYLVVGLRRRTSSFNTKRVEHLYSNPNFIMEWGNITDSYSLYSLLKKYNPDEIYHLAAQSVTENSLLPILGPKTLEYKTFKEIWDNQIKKNKKIRIEHIEGVETEVIDMPNNKQIRALGYLNGMGNWFPIKQISRHKWDGKIVEMNQKFGCIQVTPNHSILDLQQKIRRPEENPWLLNVRKINYQNRKTEQKIKFKNSFRFRNENGWLKSNYDNSGVSSREISGNTLTALCRFIGAFVAEGHTTFNKKNKSYFIGISNQNLNWLRSLQKDLYTFYEGSSCLIRHKKENYKDVYELQIRSFVLYKILRNICGTKSNLKKLPKWLLGLNNDSIMECWSNMLFGDGTVTKYGTWRYKTASYELACQLSMLFTLLGFDYTTKKYYKDKIKKANYDVYEFTQCKTYQINKDKTTKQIKYIDYSGWVYDITVDEVHNFAVGTGNIVVHNSHVRVSFDVPEETVDVIVNGTLKLLNAMKEVCPQSRLYNAASSEMFGDNPEHPQNEETRFMPASPYACAKLFGFNICRNYREAYGLHISSGILFNHEQSRRGETFVTKKITQAAARIKLGLQENLSLGNLNAKRDWGSAIDYVRGMHLMLQQDEPDDYCLATGETHTVKEFLEEVFGYAGLNIEKHVTIDERLFRPHEVPLLLGDYSKAKKKLGWEPKVKFKELAKSMYDADLQEQAKINNIVLK